jgi:hypothetical protein
MIIKLMMMMILKFVGSKWYSMDKSIKYGRKNGEFLFSWRSLTSGATYILSVQPG